MMRLRTILLLGIPLIASACRGPTGDDDSGPGVVTLRLDTPHTGDAAMKLTLRGPGITGIEAAGDFAVFVRAGAGTDHVIAVFGDLVDGAVVRFNVPDVSLLDAYTVVLNDVATTDNSLRLSFTGYAVIIER